jgi:hypothetical protein
MAIACVECSEGETRAEPRGAIQAVAAAKTGAQVTKKAPTGGGRLSKWRRFHMPLETRSIPRQIIYLLLALLVFIAALDLLARWYP